MFPVLCDGVKQCSMKFDESKGLKISGYIVIKSTLRLSYWNFKTLQLAKSLWLSWPSGEQTIYI